MKVVGVIPARLAATRLPNKPLLMIAGKTMIQHVWERAQQATSLSEVIVATPDPEIVSVVEGFGGKAVLTSEAHRSGTDRVAEVAQQIDADVIVNVQGDEPMIDPSTIDRAAEPMLNDASVKMTSLMCRCPDDELDNPACVKVVVNKFNDALYFSRARIPFARQPDSYQVVMQHVGLYAYRREFLLEIAALRPAPLEMTESLEQLRVLENGHRIRMVEVEYAPLSIDTKKDLEKALQLADIGTGSNT
jgi:3-deoxy-manno-octulosonate cytidylyltransferase (CMP-KDO synthetase)